MGIVQLPSWAFSVLYFEEEDAPIRETYEKVRRKEQWLRANTFKYK
jgi:hypothetical protein